MESELITSRLFIGGLYNGVNSHHLSERLSRFGFVNEVVIKTKINLNGDQPNIFAYVEIKATKASLKQCIQTYNKTKWKGSELRLEPAKECFLMRLEKEREKSRKKAEITKCSEERSAPCVWKMAVDNTKPGTKVEGHEDWIVGKFGRILPIMRIRRKDGKKTIEIDPSKLCHQVRNLEGKNSNDWWNDEEQSNDWWKTDLPAIEIRPHPQEKVLQKGKKTAASVKSSFLDAGRKAQSKKDGKLVENEQLAEMDFEDSTVSEVDSDSSLDIDRVLKHAAHKKSGFGIKRTASNTKIVNEEGEIFDETKKCKSMVHKRPKKEQCSNLPTKISLLNSNCEAVIKFDQELKVAEAMQKSDNIRLNEKSVNVSKMPGKRLKTVIPCDKTGKRIDNSTLTNPLRIVRKNAKKLKNHGQISNSLTREDKSIGSNKDGNLYGEKTLDRSDDDSMNSSDTDEFILNLQSNRFSDSFKRLEGGNINSNTFGFDEFSNGLTNVWRKRSTWALGK